MNFFERWSHINSQTTYIKQHKHVDFISRNVIDHQLIIEDDLGFFAIEWQHKLRLAIMFKKMRVVFLGEVHYGFFYCRNGPTNGY